MVEEKNANLSTLSVTIQALHVSGKQMTLAVFKQLPRGRLIDGIKPWGFVRYEIKDEGYTWLVFSYNGVLYRATAPDCDDEERECRNAKHSLAVATSKVPTIQKEIEALDGTYKKRRQWTLSARASIRRGDPIGPLSRDAYDEAGSSLVGAIERLEKDEADGVIEDPGLVDLRRRLELAEAAIVAAADHLRATESTLAAAQVPVRRWNAWLKECPQLFIAV